MNNFSKISFKKSSAYEHQCPKDGFQEFALIGRSNVGKSSLINSILNRKNIAKTSKKPGKTQLINHYLIENSFYIVDLPGYGYNKLSKKKSEIATSRWSAPKNAFFKTIFRNLSKFLSEKYGSGKNGNSKIVVFLTFFVFFGEPYFSLGIGY